MDVESNPQQSQQQQPTPLRKDPIRLLKTSTLCAAALWGLHGMNVYHTILHSPNIHHLWFKTGLASSIAILILKAYMELYGGKLQKIPVNYTNFRQSTHILILLIGFSSFAFHFALWPVYGPKTFLIMFMFGYGVLLQIMLLIPSWMQNLISGVLMTWFLQQYKY